MIHNIKICYFGRQGNRLIRNKFLKHALKINNVNVQEIVAPSKDDKTIFWKLTTSYRLFVKSLKADYDILWVGFGGSKFILLAKLISILKNKPLVYDIFISSYDTYVHDRKIVRDKSLKSFYYFYKDKFTCYLSDLVLLDTEEHIKYFVNTFSIPKTKFKRILIGSFNNDHKPKIDNNRFTVLFFGTFIPLQGIEYIIKAAKLLDKKVEFIIIGDGQTSPEIMKLYKKIKPKNIQFLGLQSHDFVMEKLSMCNLGLGIFGNTNKAKRVIPHKVFEIIASQKPFLTGKSMAIDELFSHGKDCFTCDLANERSLAESISFLMDDPELLNNIAENGYNTYLSNCTPEVIGADFKNTLMGLIKN